MPLGSNNVNPGHGTTVVGRAKSVKTISSSALTGDQSQDPTVIKRAHSHEAKQSGRTG